MHGRLVAVIAVLAVLTAAGGMLLRTSEPAAEAPRLGGLPSRFVVGCEFTHRAPDDPIVAPNTVAGSHDHDFFGNFTVDAASTLASLMRADARCTEPKDRSGYWVPTMLVDGRPIAAIRSRIYYAAGGKRADTIVAPPNGLVTVTGGTIAPQAVRWGCANSTTLTRTARDCGKERIELWLRFPDCWNGEELDSVDHRSHLTFASRGRCPETHPVPIPLVRMIVRYPIRSMAGASFSSGGLETAHGDLFIAWDRDVFEALVTRCINRRAC